MRKAFIRALCEEAKNDERIWLLCGDLGFSVLEEFIDTYPKRFINVGVAEQNMIGIAAGLALTGKTVFTYTIGNFAFMRCLEQIRNDVCYHNLNVKAVAVGGGFGYGSAGYTHHTIEDIAMTRVLPNITVLAPGDPVEAALATRALCAAKGPAYLRLGKGGEQVLHTTPPSFDIGRALTMSSGKDATIISSAGTLDIACEAEKQLAATGRSVGVISMPSLVPFDREALLAAATQSKCVITVEEHGKGGLGSLVAECLMSVDVKVKLRALHAAPTPLPQAGDRNWQRGMHGISVASLVATVQEALA